MLASIKGDIETNAHTIPSFGYTQPHAAAPEQASILVGETIQALRRTLDYLIFELAFLDAGSEQDGTQFPIEGSKDVFWARRKRTKLPKGWTPALYLTGVTNGHATAIEGYQPYKGADWSKALQDISNPDKHRRLIFVRGQSSVRITPKPVPKRDRMKRGIDVRRARDGFVALWRLSSDVHVKFHITAHVAFEDKTPVMKMLDHVKTEVGRAVDEFRPCFAGQCPH